MVHAAVDQLLTEGSFSSAGEDAGCRRALAPTGLVARQRPQKASRVELGRSLDLAKTIRRPNYAALHNNSP